MDDEFVSPAMGAHFADVQLCVLLALGRAYPDCIEVTRDGVSAIASPDLFIEAVQDLRDRGIIMYEMFVQDGLAPASFRMVCLTVKGARNMQSLRLD